MFRISIILLSTCLAGTAALAQQTDSTSKQPPAADKTAANHATPQAATNDPNYIIGPSDELNIDVWKEPEITRTVPVRPDGKISLPLIDDIQAAGQTPMQLAAIIAQKLSKFVTAPQVTVIVGAINSQRVYVMGEVTRTGAYPMLPGMTVLQALSSAGGFSVFAKQSGVYVLRTENGRQMRFQFNYKDVVSGKKPEQNIILKPGDTVVVP